VATGLAQSVASGARLGKAQLLGLAQLGLVQAVQVFALALVLALVDEGAEE
jgi:hypothetical protein